MTSSTMTLRARPSLEALEDRLALSSFVNGSGDLVIVGNAASNNVTVSYQVVGGVLGYRVTEDGASKWYAASRVKGGDVFFYGFAGNDYFRNDTFLRTWAFGMDGNDVLIGGSNTDHLFGGNGHDCLYGRAGNDWLDGGFGNDLGHGGLGFDVAIACEATIMVP